MSPEEVKFDGWKSGVVTDGGCGGSKSVGGSYFEVVIDQE